MRWIAVVVVAAACSKGRPDDCQIVRDKPESAMAELSSRYPNNPVKVAETIEKCVAPSGEECDRVAKIATAIPTMAPQLAPAKPFDYAKTCREAPPEFRRCLLPSYALAHGPECQEIVKKAITQIDITPKHPEGDTYPEDCAGFVSIYITKAGTWLATGRDDKARCFAPRKAGELDNDWLERELRKVKATECSPSAAELAGAPDVAYRDVIAAMDISVKVGLVDVGLSDPAGLAVPLASANAKGAASECPPSVIKPEEHASPTRDHAMPPDNVGPPPNGKDALANAPVVIITKDNVTVKVGDASGIVGDIADVKNATGTYAPMMRALPPTKDGMLILQADESTPAVVINRVVSTAKAAGYNNVMFAVKNK